MKLKKIASVAAVAAMALSVMSVSASAADPIKAVLGFSDMSWSHQDWETSVDVTADGTYTLESTLLAGAEDFGVFVIDLQGMFAAYPEATATLDKVTVDGKDIAVDASKVIYGDIEEKGNYRIEIYNQYGDTKADSPVEQATPVAESLAITFTVSGLGAAADAPADTTADAPAADSTTTPAATGNTSAAALAGVMAVAAAAAFAVKKSK